MSGNNIIKLEAILTDSINKYEGFIKENKFSIALDLMKNIDFTTRQIKILNEIYKPIHQNN